MNMADLALGRKITCFAKQETNFGELADFTSTDALVVNALPQGSQSASFTPSEEKADTRSLVRRFKDKNPPGQWSLPLYSRPSGAAGTPPLEAALWEALLGDETVDAGVSVSYTPALELPSLSLGFSVGGLLWVFLDGCMIQELTLNLGTTGGLALAFSGPCRRRAVAGKTVTVADSTVNIIKLPAGYADAFEVGARVEIDGADNAGAGYSVTAVDPAADTISIAPDLAGAPAADVVVQGFLPTPTFSGEPLPNRLSLATLGGVALPFKEGSLTVRQDIRMLSDVADGTDFAAGAVPDQRSVEGNLTAYYTREFARHYGASARQLQEPLVVVLDNGAGNKFTATLGQCEINTPEMSDDSPLVQHSTGFQGLPSAAFEDEFSAKFE